MPIITILDNTYQSAVWDEIAQAYDIRANVYFIVVDNSINAIGIGDGKISGGVGNWTSKNGGFALSGLPHGLSPFLFELVAHELGHAFGLRHDFPRWGLHHVVRS